MVRFVLALFVCAGSITFCESTSPAPPCSGKAVQNAVAAFQPGADFGKLPENWRMTKVSKPLLFTNATAGAPLNCANAPIDLTTLFQTPQPNKGLQLLNSLPAQNAFPRFQVSPELYPHGKLEPIPTRWPNLNILPIPAQWPNTGVLPIEGTLAAAAQVPPQ